MSEKHIFILNPKAGQGKALDLKKQILRTSLELEIPIEICETQEELHGEVLARNLAKKANDMTKIRIYACGGDGTLNEVINGVYGYNNVAIGLLPYGTGNDFVRNFGAVEMFRNIQKQLLAKTQDIDVIKYRAYKDDNVVERYCINMFNIGFDCNVVYEAARLKKLPLVSGSMAYLIGVAKMLIQKKGANIRAYYENNETVDGEILLIAIANGAFCGGGVKGVPRAELDDGLMDISLVNKCSRKNFIKLFPKYSKGTHLETKLAKKIISYRKESKFTIESNEDKLMFSTDGEIGFADKIEFEISEQKISFIVPTI